MRALDLAAPGELLTAALVDVPSVSGEERALADLVHAALAALPGLAVERDGNVVLARTDAGRDRRIALAGHLDTVPIADNLPSRRDGERLAGCGTSDMKSGLAVMLRLARRIAAGELDLTTDVSWIFYDCEEIEAARNGMNRLARERPEVLAADLGVLLEGTDGAVEAGCQGTMRAVVRAEGVRAHTARAWLGDNAIHALAPVLARLADFRARAVVLDGLTYREGLNAVQVDGGVAGNVVPDTASLTVNFRFAPDRSLPQARAFLRDFCSGPQLDVEIVDEAPAAPPGLGSPLAAAVVAATGVPPRAKLGWTDVARFAQLGIPALNLGPGDPELAHTRGEYVTVARIAQVEQTLERVLTG